MLNRAGIPVAGAMGNMGEARANNTWKPFFATEDIERTAELAAAHGAAAMKRTGSRSLLCNQLSSAVTPVMEGFEPHFQEVAQKALDGLPPFGGSTVDTLITAGIASSRADALRWVLGRIREHVAYSQLQQRVREIEELKSQF